MAVVNLGHALLSGLLFGVGLLISGMVDPANVIAFLDVAGDFDPRLAFVMAGALAVYAPLQRSIVCRRPAQGPSASSSLPMRGLDGALLGGAAVFGVGWGLSGLCPGPAVVNLGGGAPSALVFGTTMVVGMWIQAATARSVQ